MRVQKVCILIIFLFFLPVLTAQDLERGVVIRPAPRTEAGGQRWALIVGINDYTNVPALRYGRSDAQALYKVIVENCGFPRDNVVLMVDDHDVRSNAFARYPTCGNLRARIDQIAQVAEQNDLLIVSFSGHGLNIDGRGYLVPVDGTSNDIGSLIPLSWVKETLESSPAKQRLLLLDACHSGARGDPEESPAQALLSPLAGAAFATIASCDSRQLSHEDPKTGHGVFTHAVIEGLIGKADTEVEGNRDSTITASELFSYASLKVKQWSLKEGKKQTPVLRGKFKDRIELTQVDVSDTAIKPAESPPLTTPLTTPKTRIRRPGETFTNSVDMKLVWIPPGEFMMGSPSSEKDRYDDEGPQHRVKISKGFYIGIYEVTVGQYLEYLNSDRDSSGVDFSDKDCPVKKTGSRYVLSVNKFGSNESQPMVEVSWHGAQKFCDWLSRKENKIYRLPTEAEWEYACRAGAQTRFCFGDNETSLGDYAWYTNNSGSKTHQVGQKKPNGFGLYDMHGNVWEWCQDWYGSYDSGEQVDPTGPSSGSARVLRGGSWDSTPRHCRSADRSWDTPDGAFDVLGFRIVSLDF
jgi:formylglycine-generating enzyme required for sulfatase activity